MGVCVKRTFIRMGGVVHLALDSEHLLCMTATFDAADTEGDEKLRWHPTTSTTVTCELCAGIIALCDGVEVGRTRSPL